MKIFLTAILFLLSFNVFSEGNSKDIDLVQKQYDWQFSESKGKDKILSIVKRDAGGRVWVDDYLLSKSSAVEKIRNKCN